MLTLSNWSITSPRLHKSPFTSGLFSARFMTVARKFFSQSTNRQLKFFSYSHESRAKKAQCKRVFKWFYYGNICQTILYIFQKLVLSLLTKCVQNWFVIIDIWVGPCWKNTLYYINNIYIYIYWLYVLSIVNKLIGIGVPHAWLLFDLSIMHNKVGNFIARRAKLSLTYANKKKY